MKIITNGNLIKVDTGKAVLLKVKDTGWWEAWLPKKCVYTSGKGGYKATLYIGDNFEIRLVKYGKGQHNFKDILDEKTVNAKEFADMIASKIV